MSRRQRQSWMRVKLNEMAELMQVVQVNEYVPLTAPLHFQEGRMQTAGLSGSSREFI